MNQSLDTRFQFDKRSIISDAYDASDYAALAREVLGERVEVLSARVTVDDRGRVEQVAPAAAVETPAPAPVL